jgi:hypothetical protein
MNKFKFAILSKAIETYETEGQKGAPVDKFEEIVEP